LFGAAILFSMRTKSLVRELPGMIRLSTRRASPCSRNGIGLRSDRLHPGEFRSRVFIPAERRLNFGLARYLPRSTPGTPEFNAELGKMNGLSLPVIMLPTMVVMMVVL
jgi:hypothetical protein